MAANNSSTTVLPPPSSCLHLRDPFFQNVSERFTMNLVTAVINIITSPLAVISNSFIAVVIFTNVRLRTPSNLLIGCLALSDILVGLAVQPGYITYRLMENQHRSVPCFVRILYSNSFYICCGVSFMTLTAVSYERFVAVRLQTRYNDVFSSRRVLKYVVAIWTLNTLLTNLQWAGISKIWKGIHLILWFSCVLVSGAANIGIVFVLRRHRCQVQIHQLYTELVRRHRQVKLTRNMSVVVGIYFLFNTPFLFAKIYHQILQQDIKTYNHYSWSETLAFLNSCTNPLIYCWKNRRIRKGIETEFKKICCNR